MAGFVILAALGMVYKPAAFGRYFFGESTIFDIGNYHLIAKSGYTSELAAFYPLWAVVIAGVTRVVGEGHAVLAGSLLAAGVFLCGLVPTAAAFRRGMPNGVAGVALCLYTINPNSLFHALSYPEAVTAMLAGVFLLLASRYLVSGKQRELLGIGVVFGAMSLARPIVLQTIAAGVVAALVTQITQRDLAKRAWAIAGACTVGAVAGYCVYGAYCAEHLGSFFAPFTAQSNWGRKLGLYWSLFYAPKTVASADVVLLWDLQAFYGPGLVALLLMSACRKPKGDEQAAMPTREVNFVAWFAVLFAGCHSAIAFLTYPTFMSIGRHVFALPFLFYAFGYAVTRLWHRRRVRRATLFYVLFSAVYLICWWERYGRGGWIG